MHIKDLDVAALQKRRERALAHPLVDGDILSPSGPSLEPSAVTPLPSSLTAADTVAAESPNPYRPANLDLRDLAVQPGGWRRLSFRLVKRLCGGEGSWTQVWAVDVLEEGEVIGIAVLKLLAEALFPQRWPTNRWQPATEAEEAELRAYTAFRPVQGRDVPHCYGAFSFDMPWGETVTGVLLESFVGLSSRIYTLCKSQQEAGKFKTVEEVDKLRLGIAGFQLSPGDIHILQSSPSLSHPHVVFLDFGMTRPADLFAQDHERVHSALDTGFGPWQCLDEQSMVDLLRTVLPEVGLAWHRMEYLDVVALQKRRERALAHPLHEGDILSPSGPSLEPSAVTPLPSSLTAADTVAAESPNPYRPANLALRDLVVQPGGWRRLSFRLVKGICVGEDSWAQVWTDFFEDEVWVPADDAEKAELRAYSAFRPLQGRDVPHCYGAFPFAMPWGETTTGVVLENLRSTATGVYDYCHQRREAGDFQTAEQIDELVSSSYRTLHRLQECGITGFEFSPGDIHILHSSSSSSFHLVFLDFGMTKPASLYKIRHQEMDEMYWGQMGPWQTSDEGTLRHLFRMLMTSNVWFEWSRMETQRGRERLYMNWARNGRGVEPKK
ncbi:hypothetical protein JCM6882_008362 [Rhodosporidiobolus microsporus]